MQNMNSSETHFFRFHFLGSPIWIFLFLALLSFVSSAKTPSAEVSETRDYIVFTDHPKPGQDLRDYAIQILASVLGSKQAAEQALGYVYRNVGPGFSARLTLKQALRLQSQPGVLYVKESELYEPHTSQVASSF